MNTALSAEQVRSESRLNAYKQSLTRLIVESERAALYSALFDRLVEKYALLKQKCQSFYLFVQRFKDLMRLYSGIPKPVDMRDYLAIGSLDFGYSSWNEKTDDSSWIESFVVKSHLPNPGAVASLDKDAPFPDFLWVFGQQVEDDRGFTEWIRNSFPSSWPNGELAHTGFGAWAGRFMQRLTSVFNLCNDVRLLVVPELEDGQ